MKMDNSVGVVFQRSLILIFSFFVYSGSFWRSLQGKRGVPAGWDGKD
jgi:hypothetical protein